MRTKDAFRHNYFQSPLVNLSQVLFRLQRGLCFLLIIQIVAVCMPAQTAGFLKLTAVEGEGAFNDVRHRIAHPPVIRVVDESNNLIRGAEVTFTLPSVGPGGSFTSGPSSATATTDENGVVKCPAYKPNVEEGRFNIKVTAVYLGKMGSMIISQSNTLAGGTSVGHEKKGKALWIVLAVAGGATAGVIAATRHGATPAAAVPPTTLSTVGITVGAPK